jgi:hypothetical protein
MTSTKMAAQPDALIEKWKGLAKADFGHNDFSNWVQVTHAHQAFQQVLFFTTFFNSIG